MQNTSYNPSLPPCSNCNTVPVAASLKYRAFKVREAFLRLWAVASWLLILHLLLLSAPTGIVVIHTRIFHELWWEVALMYALLPVVCYQAGKGWLR